MASCLVGSTVFQVVAGNILVPYPYEIWRDGVYVATAKAPQASPAEDELVPPSLMTGRRRLMFRPLWVSGFGYTIDTDEPLIQLTYMDVMSQQKSVWLARGQITDERQLLQLGAAGLPIDSDNAEHVLVYLRAMEAENQGNPGCPHLRVGHRSGPYLVDKKLGWLIGKQWIGAGHMESDPRNNTKYTLALTPNGDATAWFAKWREVREESWVARFCLGASFATPLLRLLKCRTFIVHHWGQSSTGKTALANFCQAIWGNPELLFSSLNRTEISITEIFRHMTDLPILYDETQVSTVKDKKEGHAKLIYAICSPSGRERGAKDGGLRQDKQAWLTIARLTGEGPLIEEDSDLGGQFNRVLQINSPAFKSSQAAEAVYPFIAENYGHAGPAFLRMLAEVLAAEGGLALIQKLYNGLREALEQRIGVKTNHAQYGAVIATGQTLAESWLLGIPIVEARDRALDDATLALQETAIKQQDSYAEKALAKLRDHWIANKGFYVDDTSDEGREQQKFIYKMIGVETVYGMAFIPHEANDLLKNSGFDTGRVWRDFRLNGWLVMNGESPLNTMNLRNGKSMEHPVYLIRPDIFFTSMVKQRKLQLINGGLSTNVLGLEVS